MPTDPAPPADPQDPRQVMASAWQDQALRSEVAKRMGRSIRRWRLLAPEQVLARTRARKVSEQLEETMDRHLMGALPPVPTADGSPPSDPAGPGNLVRRCRTIALGVGDLALRAAVTPEAPRPRKSALTLHDDLADRLEGQIDHFRSPGRRGCGVCSTRWNAPWPPSTAAGSASGSQRCSRPAASCHRRRATAGPMRLSLPPTGA